MLSLEYIAGFFDGEGCISNRNNTGAIGVSISQNTYGLKVLQEIQKQFGGSLYQRKDKGWQLGLSTRRAGEFLEAVYPFLVVKKTEAKLAIESCNLPYGSTEKRRELIQRIRGVRDGKEGRLARSAERSDQT